MYLLRHFIVGFFVHLRLMIPTDNRLKRLPDRLLPVLLSLERLPTQS